MDQVDRRFGARQKRGAIEGNVGRKRDGFADGAYEVRLVRLKREDQAILVRRVDIGADLDDATNGGVTVLQGEGQRSG